MNGLTKEAIVQVMAAVMDSIEEVARESMPMGAPSGHVYAALMAHGMSLEMYQTMINAMVKAGRITVSNHLIRVVEKEQA